MKQIWIALAVFVLLTGVVIWNCAAVCKVCDRLLAEAEALPTDGSKADFSALQKLWTDKKQFLSLSVRRDQLLTLENAMENMIALSESEEASDYKAARSAFRTAVEAILRTEKPSVQSFF